MKNIAYTTLLLFSNFIFSQHLAEYHPIEIRTIKTDFSEAFVTKYNSEESLKICNDIWNRINSENVRFEDLTHDEKINLSYCDEYNGNPWSILPHGCSWYCGGQIDTIKSSSTPSTEKINDFDYGKPWISNLTNTNSPEFIEFVFKPESVRVTDIVFVNGNVKSFGSYSRAKKIRMSVNGKPYAILNLLDNKNEQIFRFHPIGTSKRKNFEKMKSMPNWIIKFEIIEYYKGSNNQVAISEIYFEGDGHEDN